MWNCRDGHPLILWCHDFTQVWSGVTLLWLGGVSLVEVSCSAWHPAARSGHKTRHFERVTQFLMWCQKTVVSRDVLHLCGQNLWWCGTHQQSGGGRDVSQCSWRPVVYSECPGSQLKAEYTVFSHLQLHVNCFVLSWVKGGGGLPTRCRPPETWVWRTTSTVKQKGQSYLLVGTASWVECSS